MHEAGGMQHLQSGGNVHHFFGDLSGFASTQQYQRRSHHLSEFSGQVFEGSRQQDVVGLQRRAEELLVAFQL